MIIARIFVRGFGKLCNLPLDFTPGLNMVLGPNEAGKSTLLTAIQTLLYGGAKKPEKHYAPWAAVPFGGTLFVKLSEGSQYRIESYFTPDRSSIYQEPGANDVTSDYDLTKITSKKPGGGFAHRHLGLTSVVFRASALIEQNGLLLAAAKNEAGELRASLEQLAGTGGAGKSAKQAQERLVEQVKREVNIGAKVRENSAYYRSEDRVSELERSLRESQNVLEGLEECVARIAELGQEDEALKDEVASIGASLAKRELDRLGDQLRRLATIEKAIEENLARLGELSDVSQLTLENFNRVGLAMELASQRECDLPDRRRMVEDDQPAREAAKSAIAEIHSNLAALPSNLASVTPPIVSAADTAVSTWSRAADDVLTQEGNVAQLERRLHDLAHPDGPLLASVPPTTTSAALGAAIAMAEAAERKLRDSERAEDSSRLAPQVQAELVRLERDLAGLMAKEVGEMVAEEQRMQLAEARRPSEQQNTPYIFAGLGAVFGLLLGFIVGNMVGAVVGLGALAAVGYIIGRQMGRSASTAVSEQAQARARLNENMSPYGVTSASELQRLYSRLMELRDASGKWRWAHDAADDARLAFQSALAEVKKLAKADDMAAACQIRKALEERESLAKQRDAVKTTRDEALRGLAVLTGRLGDARKAAQDTLAAVGLSASTPQEARDALTGLSANVQRREKLLADQTRHQAVLTLCDEHLRALDAAEKALRKARTEVADGLHVLGCDPTAADPQAAVAERCRRFGEYEAARRRVDKDEEARRALVGAANPDKWRNQCDELRPRAALADPGDDRPADALQRLLQAATTRREGIGRELARREAERSQKLEGVADPAEIAEKLASERRKLAGLTRLHAALTGAKEAIAEAALEYTRGVAPRLAGRMRDSMASLTDGRYDEVQIDSGSLEVRVRSDEFGGLVTLDLLSQGTQDAIQLLLRAAVVQELSTSAESIPLFLDDPLVTLDPDRTQRMLGTIHLLAKERQVFYFTQDPRVVEWACELGPAQVHDLAALTGLVAGSAASV